MQIKHLLYPEAIQWVNANTLNDRPHLILALPLLSRLAYGKQICPLHGILDNWPPNPGPLPVNFAVLVCPLNWGYDLVTWLRSTA